MSTNTAITFLCETDLDLTDQVAIGVWNGRLYVAADIRLKAIRIFSRSLVSDEPFRQLVEIPFRLYPFCSNESCRKTELGARCIYTIHDGIIYAVAIGNNDPNASCKAACYVYRICAHTGAYKYFTTDAELRIDFFCFKCLDNKSYFRKKTKTDENLVMFETKIVDAPPGWKKLLGHAHKSVSHLEIFLEMNSGNLRASNYMVEPPCCAFDVHYENPLVEKKVVFDVLLVPAGYVFAVQTKMIQCRVQSSKTGYWLKKVRTLEKENVTFKWTVSIRLAPSDKGKMDFTMLQEHWYGPQQRKITLVGFMRPRSFCQLSGAWLELFPPAANGVSSHMTAQVVDKNVAVMMRGHYVCTIVMNYAQKLHHLALIRTQLRWCSITGEVDGKRIDWIRNGFNVAQTLERFAPPAAEQGDPEPQPDPLDEEDTVDRRKLAELSIVDFITNKFVKMQCN